MWTSWAEAEAAKTSNSSARPSRMMRPCIWLRPYRGTTARGLQCLPQQSDLPGAAFFMATPEIIAEQEGLRGLNEDYAERYGFHDAENYLYKAPKGLTRELVQKISE